MPKTHMIAEGKKPQFLVVEYGDIQLTTQDLNKIKKTVIPDDEEEIDYCPFCGKKFEDGDYIECDQCGAYFCDRCDLNGDSDDKLCPDCLKKKKGKKGKATRGLNKIKKTVIPDDEERIEREKWEKKQQEAEKRAERKKGSAPITEEDYIEEKLNRGSTYRKYVAQMICDVAAMLAVKPHSFWGMKRGIKPKKGVFNIVLDPDVQIFFDKIEIKGEEKWCGLLAEKYNPITAYFITQIDPNEDWESAVAQYMELSYNDVEFQGEYYSPATEHHGEINQYYDIHGMYLINDEDLLEAFFEGMKQSIALKAWDKYPEIKLPGFPRQGFITYHDIQIMMKREPEIYDFSSYKHDEYKYWVGRSKPNF